MPVNVVRTPEKEIPRERAKACAREEYPDATGELPDRDGDLQENGSLPAAFAFAACIAIHR